MRQKTGGVARATRAPSLLEIAKAHWANYRHHLRVPEEYPYCEDAERALDWQDWQTRVKNAAPIHCGACEGLPVVHICGTA